MSFGTPWLLLALLLPLAWLIAYVWLERRPPRYVVAFPNLAVLAGVTGGRNPWRRHAIAGLVLLSLAALVLASARPRISRSAPSERATVVLLVDVSVSMNATDVKPSRFQAARVALARFVDQVPRPIRIALVAFSDDAQVITPPTTDRGLLHAGISSLAPGFGTAIGDALARAVDLARRSVGQAGIAPLAAARPTSAVVLLSDGAQTRGVLSPEDGARLARDARVPVYAIALGTLGGIVTVNRGGNEITVPVPPDRATLAQIAESTGGLVFEAADASRLAAIYERLGSVVGRTRAPREVTALFLAAGAALLVAATALAGLWAPRLP